MEKVELPLMQLVPVDTHAPTRRERIATAVLAGFASNPSLVFTWDDENNMTHVQRHFSTKDALRFADALIAELDKEAADD